LLTKLYSYIIIVINVINCTKSKRALRHSQEYTLELGKRGLLKSIKTPGGKRRYKKEDVENLLGILEENPRPRVVLYARVSTKKQKDYLTNQIRRLENFAKSKGWNYEVISEIASGVNENRRQLRKLLNMVKRGEVEKVVLNTLIDLQGLGMSILSFSSKALEWS